MKTLSAGVIIQNSNGEILGCLPFGRKGLFDIPKGHVEEDETLANAAMRELQEETSIELKDVDLKFLGRFNYNPYKDLVLFYHKGDYNLAKLKCKSTFSFHGTEVPEMIGYKWINKNEIEKLFFKSLGQIIANEIKKIK